MGEYLFLRISQANPKLRSIFGVPGDFNLALLEHFYADSVQNQKNIEFVGVCNELNAAYAADGYARYIGGMSALITTLGVGELSAINGVAGAFTEYAPILHIVGCTSNAQKAQAASSTFNSVKNIHHLIPNKDVWEAPDHDVYKKMASHVSVAMETLGTDAESNVAKIDSVIKAIVQENRPGYLYVPSDVTNVVMSEENLRKPFDFNELRNSDLLAESASKILDVLYSSETPAILGDSLVSRFNASEEFHQFTDMIPANFAKLFCTTAGRVVDESKYNYVGVYAGKFCTNDSIKNSLEHESDSLFVFGFFDNEFNNGFNTFDFTNNKNVVEIHPDYIRVNEDYTRIKDQATGKRSFSLKGLIGEINRQFDVSKLKNNAAGVNNIKYTYEPPLFGKLDDVPEQTVTENKLVDFFNSYLREGDCLIVETCSFLFAVAELKLPKNVTLFSQSFYSSIGYTLPCTFGMSRAARDVGEKRRIVLIEGDGSAQMTVQELTGFLRYEVEPPQIFLLNNEGYTIERAIKGPERSYNDIQDNWKWKELFRVLGDPNCEKHESIDIGSMKDLDALLKREKSDKVEMIDIHLAKTDYPMKIRKLMNITAGKA